jgi:hypothetical protein
MRMSKPLVLPELSVDIIAEIASHLLTLRDLATLSGATKLTQSAVKIRFTRMLQDLATDRVAKNIFGKAVAFNPEKDSLQGKDGKIAFLQERLDEICKEHTLPYTNIANTEMVHQFIEAIKCLNIIFPLFSQFRSIDFGNGPLDISMDAIDIRATPEKIQEILFQKAVSLGINNTPELREKIDEIANVIVASKKIEWEYEKEAREDVDWQILLSFLTTLKEKALFCIKNSIACDFGRTVQVFFIPEELENIPNVSFEIMDIDEASE